MPRHDSSNSSIASTATTQVPTVAMMAEPVDVSPRVPHSTTSFSALTTSSHQPLLFASFASNLQRMSISAARSISRTPPKHYKHNKHQNCNSGTRGHRHHRHNDGDGENDNNGNNEGESGGYDDDKVAFLSSSSSKTTTVASSSSASRLSNLRHQLYVFWVLFFFAGSSLGAIFINKTCLTGYHFRFPLTLVLGQMLFAITLLSIMHTLGYLTIPPARRRELTSLAIPTALFTSNVVVGLSALSLVNIPMFSAFRRLTLLFVMAAEYVFLNKTHSRAIMYTVIVMTIGAFISAVDDVTFSRLGYCLVFLNNVLTAGYLAAIKRAMKETSFDPLALLYYTAIMGFPLVATLLVSTGELAHVIVAFRTQPELVSWRFLASLVLTATGAFAVNFSTSLCTHVTSPLTTSVAGQVKNVLQTILGFFSWGFVPTVTNTVGLLIALGAQILFAYLKYRERQEEAKPLVTLPTSPSPSSSPLSASAQTSKEATSTWHVAARRQAASTGQETSSWQATSAGQAAGKNDWARERAIVLVSN